MKYKALVLLGKTRMCISHLVVCPCHLQVDECDVPPDWVVDDVGRAEVAVAKEQGELLGAVQQSGEK